MESSQRSSGPGKILVAATQWWPLSARLAAAFVRHGVVVDCASPKGHPLRYVRGISRHFRYGGARSMAGLKAAIEAAGPDAIVPCDDGVVWQMHRLHAQVPALRPVIERSLGSPAGYCVVRGRALLLQVAASAGIMTPAGKAIVLAHDLPEGDESYPAVLKLDGSCSGAGVIIAASRQEARAAFARLNEPPGMLTAIKRLLIDRDPMVWWSLRESWSPAVSLQKYIPGRPANIMVACWRGLVLASLGVEVLRAEGLTGAATVVTVVQNAAMEEAARLLVGRLELSGFCGLDFVIDDVTGVPYLIELNPRATQLGHLRADERGDLAGAFCAAAFGTTPGPPTATRHEVIALFPQALRGRQASTDLAGVYLDVPKDQPELERELLRSPAPDRGWLSRIYHRVRPRQVAEQVSFHVRTGGNGL